MTKMIEIHLRVTEQTARDLPSILIDGVTGEGADDYGNAVSDEIAAISNTIGNATGTALFNQAAVPLISYGFD